MNTNYDDEATQYQGTDNEAQKHGSNDQVEMKGAKHGDWKKAAAGAATGILIGSVSTVLMGMKKADEPEPAKQEEPEKNDNHRDHLSHPEWVDDDIQVATVVNDNMSFGQAFAAARNEVGPGGCFEWHGNVYSTHTAEEWNSMTPAERAEFNDHFSWNHHSHSSGSTSHHTATDHADHTAQHNNTEHTNHTAQHTSNSNSGHTAQTNTSTTSSGKDDDIEVVSVNHNEEHQNNESQNNQVAQNNTGAHHTTESHQNTAIQNNNPQKETKPIEENNDHHEPEVEIIGVEHDYETGANYGTVSVDGQAIVYVDVDDDLKFDYAVTDANNNGKIEDDEIFDVRDLGLTVADLGGFTDSTGDLMASNDAPDYSTDVYEA